MLCFAPKLAPHDDDSSSCSIPLSYYLNGLVSLWLQAYGVSRDCRSMLLSVCSQWAGENPRMSLAGLPAAERRCGVAASVRNGVALSPRKTAARVARQDICTLWRARRPASAVTAVPPRSRTDHCPYGNRDRMEC